MPAMQVLLNIKGLSEAKVAKMVDVSRSAFSNVTRLFKLGSLTVDKL